MAGSSDTGGREPAAGTDWRRLIKDVGTRIGLIVAAIGGVLAFIAAVGGAIVWTRFQAAHLPAEQALDAMPRGELVATGAVALAAFGVLGVVAAAAVFLIDHGGARHMRRTPGLSRGLLVLLAIEAIVIAYQGIPDVGDHETRWFRWGATAEVVILLLLISLTLIRAPTIWARTTKYVQPEAEQRQLFDPDASSTGTVPAEGHSRPTAHAPVLPAFPALVVLAIAEIVLVTLIVGSATGAWIPATLSGLGLLILVPFGVFAYKWVLRDPQPSDEQGLYLTRRGGAAMMVLAIAAVVAPPLIMGVWWLTAPLAAAALLGIAAWVTAYVTDTGFVRYGVIVFASVPCIGAVAAIANNAVDPQVQPMALIRIDDGERDALQGIYVTENDQRVYFANVAADHCTGSIVPGSGRMMWVPREKVTTMVIGPRQSVAKAGSKALEMFYALAPAAANPPMLTVDDGHRRTPAAERGPRRLVDAGPALRREFEGSQWLDTPIARVGDEVTLRGQGLGDRKGDRAVRVGGIEAEIAPRREGIDEQGGSRRDPNFHWTNWGIRFVVPKGATSGPVTIECNEVDVPPTLRLQHLPRARMRIQLQSRTAGILLDGRGSSGAGSKITSRRWTVEGATESPRAHGLYSLPVRDRGYAIRLEVNTSDGQSSTSRASLWRVSFTGTAEDLMRDRARTMERIRASLAARPDARLAIHGQYRRAPSEKEKEANPIELARTVRLALIGNPDQREGKRNLLRAFDAECPMDIPGSAPQPAGHLDIFVLDPGVQTLPPPDCMPASVE